MTSIIKPDVRPSNNRPFQTTIFAIKSTKPPIKDPRIQSGRKFDNPIPRGSAKEAQENGPWKSQWSSYPGIPTNKYTVYEASFPVGLHHNWVMQSVYETTEGASKYVAIYEGWNSTASYFQTDPNFERDNRRYIESAKIRDEFLRAVKHQRTCSLEMKRAADRHLDMKRSLLESPDHMFWLYEDLTYFHSKIHVDYGLPPIDHICLRDQMVVPPKFKYTTFNVIEGSAYEAIVEGKATKTFEELRKMFKKKRAKDQETPCEAGDKCRCNGIFHMLYSTGVQERTTPRHSLIPNNQSLLNLHNFHQPDMRIVVECSNACGCSKDCPRRRLQKGQTKRLVVFYENEVLRFGLRAAEKFRKGELICEYTGHVLIPAGDDTRDGSYDAGLAMMRCGKRNDQYMVIDSSEMGNIARFMSHACSPSAVLIETHSRVYETDPLIPRIAVYALKDIGVGDTVTISYYHESQLKSGRGSPCGCRPGCPNHLPLA